MVDLVTAQIHAAGAQHRATPLQEILQRIDGLRERFGITRLAEITRLDRFGVPVVCAMVPRSRDGLGVYNGKGRTANEARVGAVMEAVERQIAAAFGEAAFDVPFDEIGCTLDVAALDVYPAARTHAHRCVHGVDLATGNSIPVPLALVRTPWDGAPFTRSTHTNGLAVGSTVVEAIYHALLEIVERHVWSLCDLQSRVVPRMIDPSRTVDIPFAREVALPTGVASIDEMFHRATNAGLVLRLLSLPSESLPWTFLASLSEPDARAVRLALGIAASWSPEHAAVRAIVEAAQSRLVDIQGAREDIMRSDGSANGRWYADGPATSLSFATLVDVSTHDITADLRRLIDCVSACGARRIAAVDLTPPGLGVHVVRVVVPEFSTYVIDGRLGRLARERIRSLVSRTTSGS